ncbi:MAG: spore cortex-lytic enzyme [Firmicutes bacterium HGW-Firmicutes-13]|nr:MAG: spore cortex-lytic enzyme [Firmicutes bacterium HGW-Firmicutes-13]
MKKSFLRVTILLAVVFLLMAGTIEAAGLGSRDLKFGDRGDDVAELQILLNSLGFSVGQADGIFGPLTEKAVINFQRAKGIAVDGIVKSQTHDALNIRNSTNTSVYRIQRGDTLWKIAQKYNISVNELKTANNLTSDYIIAGQDLKIPGNTVLSRGGYTRFSPSDIDLLARLVRAEAGGEPYIGQVAVAATVLNRVKSSKYPNTIPGVVYQTVNGFIQYCPVRIGTINLPATETARKAVLDAVNGWDPTNGAVSFFNPRTASNAWIRSSTVTANIGNHRFVF